MGVLHNFQCTLSAASVTLAKFLCMDMTIALKSLNEMQQTVSFRLTIIQYDITVVYVTYFQMYNYLMQ